MILTRKVSILTSAGDGFFVGSLKNDGKGKYDRSFIFSGTTREAFLYIRCNAGNGFTYTCRDNLQGSLSPNDGDREKSSFPLFTVTPETEQTYIRA